MKTTRTAKVDCPETLLPTGRPRSTGHRPWWLFAAIAALLPACGDGNGGGSAGATTSSGGSGGSTATTAGGSGTGGDITTGTGGSGGAVTTGTGGSGGSVEQAYPPGPYGFDVGSTITNYAFVGFPAPQVSVAQAELVHLGDFYNPTGQGTYPAGSPYGAGTAMPRALLLDAVAVWAGPCNFEADSVLPTHLSALGTCLEAIDILMDGPTPGKAATEANAVNWANKYPTGYPVVIDPADQLTPIFAQDAFPTNILIDTTTMTILDVVTGVPGDTFFQTEVTPLCQ